MKLGPAHRRQAQERRALHQLPARPEPRRGDAAEARPVRAKVNGEAPVGVTERGDVAAQPDHNPLAGLAEALAAV